MIKNLSIKAKLTNVLILAIPTIMALFLANLPEVINLSLIGQKYDSYA